MTASGIAVLTGLAALSASVAHASGPPSSPVETAADVRAADGTDPYFPDFGDPSYLPGHYDLALRYDPYGRTLEATAVVTARAVRDLRSLALDLNPALKVSAVTVGTAAAAFAQPAGKHRLVVTPAAPLPAGTTFTVGVRYSGMPRPVKEPDGGLGTYGWIPTADGAVAVNQPTGAFTWYPVNELNTAKATYAFHLTVPKSVTALANGEPAGERPSGAAYHTFDWAMRQPMAPELATVAIGHFTVDHGKVGKIPVISAIQTSLGPSQAQRKTFNATTADLLTWETGLFGRYPFASSGGVMATTNVGYALETQSRPTYDTDTPKLNRDAVTTIAHELAHQWFGDSVTPARWSDLWLNEGFATYTEWLYAARLAAAHKPGGMSLKANFARAYALPANDPRWQVRPDAPGRNGIFDWAVYERGAMTLHLLRGELGDTAFWRLVRRWAAVHKGGNVSTAEFEALAQSYTSKDLGPFFRAWLDAPGRPGLPGA